MLRSAPLAVRDQAGLHPEDQTVEALAEALLGAIAIDDQTNAERLMRGLRDFIDEALWITTAHGGPDKRYYLLRDNPHTFVGRMSAFDAEANQGFCISKHEIVTMSREAGYFVAGFLAGNQPRPPVDAERDPLPEDHPEQQGWRRAVALFAETGAWRPGRVCERCGSDMVPSCPPGFLCERCLQPEI